MDSLHFGIRSVKQGSATDHIAYIMREGRFAAKKDLVATGHGNMPSFAEGNPSELWKACIRFERKNGSAFRSLTISLPNGLSTEQLKELAWRTAWRIAGIKPFQFALHMPPATFGDQLNPHIHLVLCDRVPDGHPRPPEQIFRRYNPKTPELGGCRKDSGGKSPIELRAQLRELRRAVAEEINFKLEEAGLDRRVDHRTFKERGIARRPEPYLGPVRVRKMTAEERIAVIQAREE